MNNDQNDMVTNDAVSGDTKTLDVSGGLIEHTDVEPQEPSVELKDEGSKKARKHKEDSDELTELQKSILAIIKMSIKENSFPPTVREICIGTGVGSTSTIHSNLKRMTDLGYIKYTPSTRRAIVLCDKAGGGFNAKTVAIPVLGEVAAGMPILAVDNIQEYYKLPPSLLHGAGESDAFILRIRGESMIEIGMFEGDLIVVNSTASVNNGEIAVVRVEGETATVKRFYQEDNDIVRLQPENSAMDPIIVPISEVEIIGKVVALLRQY